MTLTREPSSRRASQIGERFVDAAADLADDALADVHQLRIVAETDIGELDLAGDFDEDAAGAVDHDVGDIVAGQQRFERAVAQHVVADVLEQMFLLGDRHHDRLDRDDLVDDVADFLARRIRIELGQLRQIDRVDQRVKDRGLDLVVVFRARIGDAGRLRLGRGRCGSRYRSAAGAGCGGGVAGLARAGSGAGVAASGGRRRRAAGAMPPGGPAQVPSARGAADRYVAERFPNID